MPNARPRERVHKTTDIIVAFARYGVAVETISRALVTPEHTVTATCMRAIKYGEMQTMPPQSPEDRAGAHVTEIVHLRQELSDAKALLQETQRRDPDLQFGLCKNVGLTRAESCFVNTLLSLGEASRDRLYHAMYGDRLDVEQPEPRVIHVFVCNVRQKLKAFGITITTVWGVGYAMSASDAARLRALAKGGLPVVESPSLVPLPMGAM
jgi:hypothetical protein